MSSPPLPFTICLSTSAPDKTSILYPEMCRSTSIYIRTVHRIASLSPPRVDLLDLDVALCALQHSTQPHGPRGPSCGLRARFNGSAYNLPQFWAAPTVSLRMSQSQSGCRSRCSLQRRHPPRVHTPSASTWLIGACSTCSMRWIFQLTGTRSFAGVSFRAVAPPKRTIQGASTRLDGAADDLQWRGVLTTHVDWQMHRDPR